MQFRLSGAITNKSRYKMKHQYEIAKKAYIVGTKEGIEDYKRGYPEPFAELVWVNPSENRNRAKSNWEWVGFDIDEWIDMRAVRSKHNDKYVFEGKERYLSEIQYLIQSKEWKSKMKKMVSENKGRKVYIWSGQWGAYWGKNYCGYTNKIADVGIYPIEDAWAHTYHCGLEKRISFEFLEPNQTAD